MKNAPSTLVNEAILSFVISFAELLFALYLALYAWRCSKASSVGSTGHERASLKEPEIELKSTEERVQPAKQEEPVRMHNFQQPSTLGFQDEDRQRRSRSPSGGISWPDH